MFLALLPWPINFGLVDFFPGLEPQACDNRVCLTPWETAPHSEQKAKPPAAQSLWLGWSLRTQLPGGGVLADLAKAGWCKGTVLNVVPFLGKDSTYFAAAA